MITFGAASSTSFDAAILQALQNTSDHIPLLGTGIISTNGSVRNKCVLGTAKFGGSSISSFYSGPTSSGPKLSVPPRLGRASFEQGDAPYDFSFITTDQSYTFSFNYQATLTLGNQIFVLDAPPLNVIGVTSIATSTAAFIDSCGDRYVQQREIGGKFYKSLQFQFANRSEREEFLSKFSLPDIDKLNDAVSEALATSGIDGAVVLRAIQVGGDPGQLLALKGETAQSLEPTTICSFRDLHSCRELNSALWTYHAAFGLQFAKDKIPDPATYDGASIVSIFLQDYGVALVPGIRSLNSGAKDILAPLSSLAWERARINADIDRVEILLGYFSDRLTSEQVVNLKNLEGTLRANALSVKSLALGCFDTPDTCAVNVRDLTLVPIDPELLSLPRKAPATAEPNPTGTPAASTPATDTERGSSSGSVSFPSLLGMFSLLVARIACRRIRIMLVARNTQSQRKIHVEI